MVVTIGPKPFGVLKRGLSGLRLGLRLIVHLVTIGPKSFGVLKLYEMLLNEVNLPTVVSLSGQNPSGY